MMRLLVGVVGVWLGAMLCQAQAPAISAEYAKVQARLAQGWNTWNTHTVASAVLLPQGLEIRLGLKQNSTENRDAFLPTVLIGRRGAGDERVHPGPHAYDGSYTDLTLDWHGYTVRVETGHSGADEVMLVTPLGKPKVDSQPLSAVFSVGVLWNRNGVVEARRGHIVASGSGAEVKVFATADQVADVQVPVAGPYLAEPMAGPVGVSTGQQRSVSEIQTLLQQQRAAFLQATGGGGSDRSAVREAIESTLAWDTVYEPEKGRVLSPVSRIWNENWGGYVVFDWDTFFAATMAAVDDKDLAYANAVEVLNEATAQGFLPNYARAGGWKSSDRSEPPVGAITVLGLYRKFGERWLLEQTFDGLLRWNDWWAAHRDVGGYLVWGSDGGNAPVNLDDTSRGTMQGARYESGLDNSPMYDSPAYDAANNHMLLADVGLMSMYIADCDALATMADELGRGAEAERLRERAAKYRRALDTLWDARRGIYLNKDLRTGQFSMRLSPTNFYPMLAKAATPEQADAMIRRHLMNPQEFWGERVLPSIARDDPAFKDQSYWRGRIWGPMNYLVYLGLRKYDTPTALEAQRELAAKSMTLFLGEWRRKGHVHENYSATSEDSDTVTNSDAFYHWGALLGLMGYEQPGQ